MKLRFKLLLLIVIANLGLFAQGSPDYGGGLKVKFDEEGKKYLRIISWAQVQANYADNAADDKASTTFQLRRARVLLFSQISPKFMIVTHFGLNSLNAETMHATGKGDGAQIFMHDAWGQYNINEKLSIGAGLHYYNGISRLNSQSTLNIMTLDNNRQSWSTLGLSDQFARHLGVFAKGELGKLQYQVSINDAITNGLDNRTPAMGGAAVYGGKRLLGSKEAGKTFSGYVSYNIWDKESFLLPFKVGSYVGTKKVLNVGVGYFTHPNGSVFSDLNGDLKGENVNLMAMDIFCDTPIGSKGAAITGYAVWENNDYGKDYLFNAYGSGQMFYSHIGYLIPGAKEKTRFQPYISYLKHNYHATEDSKNRLGIGANAYFSGHNSKLTIEYANEKMGDTDYNTLSLQAMIYL
jgi:hypothetical protein